MRITLTPFLIKLNDFINEFNVSKSAALRFADDFRIVTLLFSEEIDIQHLSRFPLPLKNNKQQGPENASKIQRERALSCKTLILSISPVHNRTDVHDWTKPASNQRFRVADETFINEIWKTKMGTKTVPKRSDAAAAAAAMCYEGEGGIGV